eukprot:gene31864-39364_t
MAKKLGFDLNSPLGSESTAATADGEMGEDDEEEEEEEEEVEECSEEVHEAEESDFYGTFHKNSQSSIASTKSKNPVLSKSSFFMNSASKNSAVVSKMEQDEDEDTDDVDHWFYSRSGLGASLNTTTNTINNNASGKTLSEALLMSAGPPPLSSLLHGVRSRKHSLDETEEEEENKSSSSSPSKFDYFSSTNNRPSNSNNNNKNSESKDSSVVASSFHSKRIRINNDISHSSGSSNAFHKTTSLPKSDKNDMFSLDFDRNDDEEEDEEEESATLQHRLLRTESTGSSSNSSVSSVGSGGVSHMHIGGGSHAPPSLHRPNNTNNSNTSLSPISVKSYIFSMLSDYGEDSSDDEEEEEIGRGGRGGERGEEPLLQPCQIQVDSIYDEEMDVCGDEKLLSADPSKPSISIRTLSLSPPPQSSPGGFKTSPTGTMGKGSPANKSPTSKAALSLVQAQLHTLEQQLHHLAAAGVSVKEGDLVRVEEAEGMEGNSFSSGSSKGSSNSLNKSSPKSHHSAESRPDQTGEKNDDLLSHTPSVFQTAVDPDSLDYLATHTSSREDSEGCVPHAIDEQYSPPSLSTHAHRKTLSPQSNSDSDIFHGGGGSSHALHLNHTHHSSDSALMFLSGLPPLRSKFGTDDEEEEEVSVFGSNNSNKLQLGGRSKSVGNTTSSGGKPFSMSLLKKTGNNGSGGGHSSGPLKVNLKLSSSTSDSVSSVGTPPEGSSAAGSGELSGEVMMETEMNSNGIHDSTSTNTSNSSNESQNTPPNTTSTSNTTNTGDGDGKPQCQIQ